jgi:putative acetyltransferase
MTMRVRPALVYDQKNMLALWERSVRATHHFLKPEDIAALGPLVAEELAGDTVDWWVLEESGMLIGFLGVAEDRLEALFVDPARQRRGNGSLLVAHAQHLCAGTLMVDVNEQNEEAIRFYEALGFSTVGRSPTDAGGRPFPILHMRRAMSGAAWNYRRSSD